MAYKGSTADGHPCLLLYRQRVRGCLDGNSDEDMIHKCGKLWWVVMMFHIAYNKTTNLFLTFRVPV